MDDKEPINTIIPPLSFYFMIGWFQGTETTQIYKIRLCVHELQFRFFLELRL